MDETMECAQEMPHEEIILWQNDAPEGYRASVRILKWEDQTRVPTLRMSSGSQTIDSPYVWQAMPIDHECGLGTGEET